MLKQHVLVELKQFIQSLSSVGYRGNPNLTSHSLLRTSLHLLEDLPSAREIVFEYFALIAEVGVQSYVNTTNVDQQTGLVMQQQKIQSNQQQQAPISQEDPCFEVIQQALENMVSKGPSAWGAVIASWSLDLVGSLSDKYSKRTSIGAACNYWLASTTMRGLLTLISICFRKLTNAEAESCVETLLGAYQRYSMTFDWVVARLGGCFPSKIISQILQCSLKKFAENYPCRFDSEIGILEYLCFAHEQVLRVCFKELLQEGFQPKKKLDALVVPFMLDFCNYSDTLLQNMVSVFLEMYNDDLRTTITQKAPLWMTNRTFAEIQPSLNNLVLRLKTHGAQVLITVAKMADQYAWCQDFLEFSLQELEQIVLNARLCPLMDDLATEETKYMLWKSCLSTNIYEQQTAVRLLLIVSTQHSHIYYQTISELLRKSYTLNPSGLGAAIRMIGGQSGVVEFPEIKPGIQMVLEDALLQEQFKRARLATASDVSEALNIFKNLNTITKMEKKNTFFSIRQHQMSTALNECLPKILQILEVTLNKLILRMDADANERSQEKFRDIQNQTNNNTIHVYNSHKKQKLGVVSVDHREEDEDSDYIATRLTLAHTIIDLLNTIEAGSKTQVIRTTEILKLAVLSVKYFFISLKEQSSTLRLAAVNRVYVLFQRQCRARKSSRSACLRELIEGALFYYGYLFGQYEEPIVDELLIPEHEMILVQNQKQSFGPNSNRSILHAGVIGRGLRPENMLMGERCPPEMQSLFLKALEMCCTDGDRQVNTEPYSTISLLLVEMVSTDVMYNGLPFPDEEFTKVTMERDLLIRRAFLTSPILWALLGFIATHRPALCISSVLLRALCATCLHQWRAKNVNKYDTYNLKGELLQSTKNLLKVLSMGQLLPPPLSNLHNIIEHFEPSEVALLLKECVWNYMKDHVPSPPLFHVDNNGLHWRNAQLNKIPPQYVDTLRNLMQKKLTKLGQHYHQMFIMPEVVNLTTNANLPAMPQMRTMPTVVLPTSAPSEVIDLDKSI
ncbi:integrator complex subunit 5 [Stomoxys calcitrans]|uniref:integrator complex subunit 5 n=1 Tax=Stomoxys calcitrans TaxID=35570 RepID=UPI0027E33CCE|nr:integrator complex subunit 5 [Stomoxys calcitrans]